MYSDAKFSVNWNKYEPWDHYTDRSQHRYVTFYDDIPIVHKSYMPTDIALSSTESYYTGLSYELQDTFKINELLNDMKRHYFIVGQSTSKVHCKVFEYNSEFLQISNIPKNPSKNRTHEQHATSF